MISQKSIDEVLEKVAIEEVIGELTTIKKRGVNYTGNCPFHNEKTGSFVVSPVKNIYKCFGCGASGNAVKFVMQHERKSFPEAIEYLAQSYNITLEKIEHHESEEKIELREQIFKVNEFAATKYQKQLLDLPDDDVIKMYVLDRHTLSDIIQWKIGVAFKDFKFLTTPVINRGMYTAGITGGLIKEVAGQGRDFFINRIIYPIQDLNGNVTGYSGRFFPGTDEKRYPKYMNTGETDVYVKGNILYGFNFAKEHIAKSRTAYLVEGNTDVITMQREGFLNTVGTCGTALTEKQATLLKRYADKIVIIRDADSAGVKAAKRDTGLLVRYGFTINTVILPEGQDPDSLCCKPDFFNSLSLYACSAVFGFNGRDYIQSMEIDSLQWLFDELLLESKISINDYANAIAQVRKLLNSIPDENVRLVYKRIFCKKSGIKDSDLKLDDRNKNKRTEKDDLDLTANDEEIHKLTPEQRDQYLRFGFYEVLDRGKTGYYFREGYGGAFKPKTNYLVEPLYHVYGSDNRRMIKVTNGVDVPEVIEMDSKTMLSVDTFCSSIHQKGHYIPLAGFSKDHLLRIHSKIGNKYPRVFEITSLGQQPEGFFAFQNNIYMPGTKDAPGAIAEYNEYGIAAIGEKMFLSPSLSKTYDGLRENENPYENDLFLQWKKSPIEFHEWCNLMSTVYGKNGWMGIAWCVGTLFRDVINKTAPLPHINPYGQKGSGKSMFGDSLNWLFFSGKDSFGDLYKPFNLNQGTDYAFFNRYERFSNCPNILNEFDENGIKDERFRAIKSSFDGEGREKGKGTKNLATSQKIRSSTCIQGQYLSTKDDNSVTERALPLSFVKAENRPEDQVIFFNRLKKHEAEGLSGLLCDILDLRHIFLKMYPEIFDNNMQLLQETLHTEGVQTMDRMLKNVTCMITCVEILLTKFELPFSLDQFRAYAKEYLKDLLSLVVRTSKISEFWKIMQTLIEIDVLEEGWEYDLEYAQNEVNLLEKGEVRRVGFTEPKNLLYIRFDGVYSHFAKEFRIQTGVKATNDATLEKYIKEQNYYVGLKKSHKFASDRMNKKINTSCMVIDLELVGMQIAESATTAENENVVGVVGVITKSAEPGMTPGVFMFSLRTNIVENEGSKDEKFKEIHMRCFTRVPTAIDDLKELKKLKFSGRISKNYRGKEVFRSFTVDKYEAEVQGELNFGKGELANGTDDDLPF